MGSQGVGAAGDGWVEQLGHHPLHLPDQGELGQGEPPRYVAPQELGGTGRIFDRRMKWPCKAGDPAKLGGGLTR
jgi:hypothetical protein